MPRAAALHAFIRLSRLKFLTGGFLGFALGAAIAHFDGFSVGWAGYLQGQIMVTAFHVMVHYSNDYFDRFCDVGATRTKWSGGSGVLVEGGLPAHVALVAALATAAIGIAAVVDFAVQGRFVAAAVGVAIAILGWVYSAPPLRLSARGWGELDTAVIVAILFPLAGYATFAGTLALRPLLSALPSAAAMLVLMFCVEYPDVEVDRETGKRNLVVRAGRPRARLLVYAALAMAYLTAGAAVVFGAASTLAIFVVLTLPLAWGLVEQLAGGDLGDGRTNAEIAARGVAFFVTTILGSTLAYVAVL
jgi:1,4-dihydroxy-2-naphthoate polyprenyltransferase